jgi:hypothetical protein
MIARILLLSLLACANVFHYRSECVLFGHIRVIAAKVNVVAAVFE